LRFGEKQKLRLPVRAAGATIQADFRNALRQRGVHGRNPFEIGSKLARHAFPSGPANNPSVRGSSFPRPRPRKRANGQYFILQRESGRWKFRLKDKTEDATTGAAHLELTQTYQCPDWLTVDRDALKGKVSRIPSREEIQPWLTSS